MKKMIIFECCICIFVILLTSINGSIVSKEIHNSIDINNKQIKAVSVDEGDCFPCEFRPLCIYYAYMIFYYSIAADMLQNMTLIQKYLNWIIESFEFMYYDILECEDKELRISLSKSPIYEGETLTVSITSNSDVVSNAVVEFAETTVLTDNNGQAIFIAPDPGVESAVYIVTAEKEGYITAEKSITVIKSPVN